jgi:hypothetical protein
VAAIVRGVGRLLVGCAAAPGEEIVGDIKTTGDGADGVEPDLPIRHVAQVGIARDARGAADAVHGGSPPQPSPSDPLDHIPRSMQTVVSTSAAAPRD